MWKWVFAAGAALFIAREARAQGPDGAHAYQSYDEVSRKAFLKGREAFQQGRFEEALNRFTQAYKLSRRPELLYNIGMSAQRLNRPTEALDAYLTYLVHFPQQREELGPQIQALKDVHLTREVEKLKRKLATCCP